MPVVIRKKPEPAPVPAVPAVPAGNRGNAGITRDEVQAMLEARDAEWERRFAALALVATQQPAAPPPRKGADIEFKRNLKGEITGAAITPKG